MRHFALALLIAIAASCGGNNSTNTGDASPSDDSGSSPDASPLSASCTPAPGIGADGVRLKVVASGLTAPVFATAPTGDARLFIVQQGGTVRVVEDGRLLDAPFLDIASDLALDHPERGLLGLAFHPNYATNGRLFIYYTANGTGALTIEEYVMADPAANTGATSAGAIIEVPHSRGNHNAGMIAFSPMDGYLWAPLGDGGGGGDPDENGQNNATWLGGTLRLDVDSGAPYVVPQDNPWADGAGGAKPELAQIGLRNPWRWSFDRSTGDMYLGDVGQRRREEIHIANANTLLGLNFGWDIQEGTECFNENDQTNPLGSCSISGLEQPVVEIDRVGAQSSSVVGGFVYRGDCLPDLAGTYFYGEVYTGQVWSLEWNGSAVQNHESRTGSLFADPEGSPINVGGLFSFGEDGFGELYLMGGFVPGSGAVYQLVAATP